MKLLLTLFAIISLTSCSVYDKHVYQLEQNVKIGNSLKANKFKEIYFSAQPKTSDFKTLREEGFKTVINIRDKNEHNERLEKKTVLNLGMNYYNVPFNKKSELTDMYIEELTSIIKENADSGKVLLHCSSGNRVGIYLGGHFHKDHGQTKEKAMLTARKLGLNKAKAVAKLNRYFNK